MNCEVNLWGRTEVQHKRKLHYLAGLKPPRKSEVSVCWLQLRMWRRWPLMRAAIWHTVVFPVPVSPTSNTGSMLFRHLHNSLSEHTRRPHKHHIDIVVLNNSA